MNRRLQELLGPGLGWVTNRFGNWLCFASLVLGVAVLECLGGPGVVTRWTPCLLRRRCGFWKAVHRRRCRHSRYLLGRDLWHLPPLGKGHPARFEDLHQYLQGPPSSIYHCRLQPLGPESQLLTILNLSILA